MLTANHTVLTIVDYINMWGLVLIGLSLFIGLFSRYFSIFGIVLIFLYYIAYPPFAGFSFNAPTEGSYWIVNKNLIEMAALFVLYFFPTGHITGLDLFFNKIISKENG
jgi:thiosulfate dehydrogenase [quinone] large subunit